MGKKRAVRIPRFIEIPIEKREYCDALLKAQTYFRGLEKVDEEWAHYLLKIIQEHAIAAGFDPRLASQFVINVEEQAFPPNFLPIGISRGNFILNCLFEESARIEGRERKIDKRERGEEWNMRKEEEYRKKQQDDALNVDKNALDPPCQPSEREYYKSLFGFDPVMDRTILPYGYGATPPGARVPFYDIDESYEDGIYTTPYRYEAEFPLAQDPPLSALGVTVLALVEYDCRRTIHNLVVFKRGEKESHVACVHTVAYNIPEAPIEEDDEEYSELKDAEVDFDSSRESHQMPGNGVILPPWGHFAALRSFVGGIAEFGVTQIITFPITPREEGEGKAVVPPFGMNEGLLQQFLRAVEEIAPSATAAIRRDFLLNLLENSSVDWLSLHPSPLLLVGCKSEDDDEHTYIMPWQDSRTLLDDLCKYAPADWINAHKAKITAYFNPLATHGKSRGKRGSEGSRDLVHREKLLFI